MYQAIQPEFSEILSGVYIVVFCNQVGTHFETVLNSADCCGKGTSSVRKGNTHLWQFFKHASENHGADGKRSLRRHTHQPWEPVIRHLLFAHHVPRMHEDGSA